MKDDYTSFSDMKAERNEIWTSVYPAVRSHCLDHELDFSFVDMRSGRNVAVSIQFIQKIPKLDIFITMVFSAMK